MKTCTWLRRVVPAFLLFLIVLPVRAQYNLWDTENGVAIRQGRHIDWHGSGLARDEDGNYLVAWSEAPDGSQDIRAQLYNAAGEAQWAEGGVWLARQRGPQQLARAMRASDGSWIVSWVDFRNDPEKEGNGEIYLQKLTHEGTPLWAEPAGPLPGCGPLETMMDIFPESDGGALVVWRTSSRSTLVQRISPLGTSTWPDPVQFGVSLDENLVAVPDGADGIVVARLLQVDNPSLWYLQRIAADGTLLWGEAEDGIPVENLNHFYDKFFLVPYGPDGLVTAWSDYDDATVRLQKYDMNGVPQFGTLGDVVLEREHFTALKNVRADGTDIFLVGNEAGNLCFQKVDISAETAQPLWNDLDGVALVDAYTSEPDLIPDGEGGVYSCPFYGGDALVGHATATGIETYSSFPLGTLYSPIRCVLDGTNLTAFRLQLNDGLSGLTRQAMDVSTGNLVDSEPVSMIAGLGEDTNSPQILRSGDNAFAAWQDDRFHNRMPYVQRIDAATGASLEAANGIELVADPDLQGLWFNDLTLCEDGTGGMIGLTSWATRDEGHLVAQKIAADGSKPWGEDGRVLFTPTVAPDLHNLLLVDREDGAFIAGASYYSEDYWLRVYVNRFDADGQPLWGEGVDPLEGMVNQDIDCSLQNILPLPGDQTLLVIWTQDFLNRMPDLLFVKLDAEGTILRQQELNTDFSSMLVPVVSFHQVELERTQFIVRVDANLYLGTITDSGVLSFDSETPLLANVNQALIEPTADGFVATWRDRDTEGIAKFQRYNRDGQPQLAEGGVEVMTFSNYVRPKALIPDLDGGAYVVALAVEQRYPDLYYTHVTPQGTLASETYGPMGLPLAVEWFQQEDPVAVPDGNGGFLAAWNDWRGSIVEYPHDDVYAMRVNDFTTGANEPQSEVLPQTWSLAPVYPNPFNPSTTVRYTVPRAGQVRVAVYDLLGREVARLVDGVQPAGEQRVVWRGVSASGSPVASGTYVVRLEGRDVRLARKAVLLK